eukprot:CAMPEP_0172321782 /NCGR_PEP_ID=MMETSP1058-20130122/44286_1 /TAXON_ID=83371 /ORGANISM="Detonula confervacea, Strain CCMP 353" /LENGTH=573 /DNA_ID=CAMNT_0013037377 /DNA_START=185 /DNA_END=1906 /DNA_ORIENTATION=-
MTPEETKLVISIIQQNDPSLESLKQPTVQVIIKQRKGRWVQEEEEFANFLSQEFCSGLSEIDNGVTKRAYLSSKLSCPKMRISKKFKGQNNGKEVFTHKAKRPDGSEFTPQEIHFYKQLHVELEKKFIKSVLKSVIKGGVKKNAKKKKAKSLPPNSPPIPQHIARGMKLPNAVYVGGSARPPLTNDSVCIQNNTAEMPVPSQNRQLNLEFHVAGFAPSANTRPNLSTSAQMNDPVFVGHHIPTIAHQDAKPSALCSQPAAISKPTPYCVNQPNAMPAITIQAPPGIANLIHNGLPRNTVKKKGRSEAPSSYQAPVFANHGQNSRGTNNVVDSQRGHYAVSGAAEGPRKRQISELVSSVGYSFPPLQNAGEAKRFKHMPAATASQAASTSTSEPSSNDESENSSSSNEASSNSNGMFSDNEIPDLLSGFDKHVASMKKTTPADMTDIFKNRPIPADSHFFAGAGGIGESPYITSKSFDELHQFWQSGLSSDKMPHLDLNQSIGNNYQPVFCSTGHRSAAGASVSQQIRCPPSVGVPYVPQVPVSAKPPPILNAPHHYFDQRSFLSDSSDLTTSD